MNNKITKIVAAIQAVAALCVIGAVKIWAPVCTGLLTLESGKQTFMKCHYTGQAAIAIAVILLVSVVVLLFSKDCHKLVQVISIVSAIMMFLLFTTLIGICANTEMQCHQTAFWCKGAAIVIIVTGIVDLLSGKKGQIPA